MVPRTLPTTTASAILVAVHETNGTPMLLYMTESSISFALKARNDEDILKLCYSDYLS